MSEQEIEQQSVVVVLGFGWLSCQNLLTLPRQQKRYFEQIKCFDFNAFIG